MNDYQVSQVYPGDKHGNGQVDALLRQEGIRRDQNLDYTCGIFDDNENIVATGSCFGNTLRCLAVSSSHQGEGLMNKIVTNLIEVQYARGNLHLFLYTKCDTAKFFQDLGFYEIVRVEDQNIVFMENRRTGFEDYLDALKTEGAQSGLQAAAVVMNANPFTLGHRFLAEKAAAENELLHLFIVSEDVSLIPLSVRKRLVMEGTSHLHNIVFHDSGPYIISNATFPSYFQKDEQSVIAGHAKLDLAVFRRIAAALHITRRYVGEEPKSQVTGIYNRIMAEELPKSGIECVMVPRKKADGQIISASTVRTAIHDGDFAAFKKMVPPTTFRYFTSRDAIPVIQRIRSANDVVHY
ncbi:[Citrate [pro-3S]-lyase] ligase [Ruminococcaceae bacterium BL-6]|nr:[Citrate [pro-3S]-lyase] ligase [Ruminococcaceae bacterium BL-6]